MRQGEGKSMPGEKGAESNDIKQAILLIVFFATSLLGCLFGLSVFSGGMGSENIADWAESITTEKLAFLCIIWGAALVSLLGLIKSANHRKIQQNT